MSKKPEQGDFYPIKRAVEYVKKYVAYLEAKIEYMDAVDEYCGLGDPISILESVIKRIEENYEPQANAKEVRDYQRKNNYGIDENNSSQNQTTWTFTMEPAAMNVE